jgi:LacI family transcriptional regulator
MALPSSPTVREIARQLDLSTATVSYALRHHPCVAQETMKRVQEAAKAAGYRPNAMVNALMTKVRQKSVRTRPRGEVVAFLHAYEKEDGWADTPSLKLQYEGARERAGELGFDVQPFWLGHRGDQSGKTARILRARGIRGAIIAPVPITDMRPLELDWQAISFMAISYTFSQRPVHRVVHHHFRGITGCFTHLRKLGYKRIGLATLREDNMEHIWIAGFLASQQIHRAARLPILVMDDTMNPDNFQKWRARHKPDALITVHNWLGWLRKLGLRPPEDIGYASLDIGTVGVGGVAGTLQDNAGMGATAVAMVASSLLHNEIGLSIKPTITMIDGEWVDGPTLCSQQ